MTRMVIGPPDSGKSLLAEELTMETGCRRKYYLATMKILDPDGRARVERHRKQREGKGFITIEKAYDLPALAGELSDAEDAALLLECVSNLVGNEMHDNPARKNADCSDPSGREWLAEEIVRDILAVAELVRELILVTAEYDREGAGYDSDTENYVHLLNLVNEKLLDCVDEIHDLRKHA